MPRLLMVNVAPEMSAGRSFRRGRARRGRGAAMAISARLAAVRVGNHGGDHAIVDGHGDAHVDVMVQANSFGGPACVESRVLQQHARDERHQQIGVRDADLMRAFDLGERRVRDMR